MHTRQSSQVYRQVKRWRSAVVVVNILLIVSLACSLPTLGRQTPTPTPTATDVELAALPLPSPTPLPPALVESIPPPGSEIPLTGPIKLFFNQAMDRRSVESAIIGQPLLSGRFDWEREDVLTFHPDKPFLPGSEIEISINDNALSLDGLALLNPITLSYRAVGHLRLTQALPEPGAESANPTSPIVVSFNRPIFPLGESATANNLVVEPVLTLEPFIEGRGEWSNTSTYIFYPEPALQGGETYTVSVNPGLQGLDGSPLANEAEGSLPLVWSFSTSLPDLVSISVDNNLEGNNFDIPLDSRIRLTFNQAMDPDSVVQNFSLLNPNGSLVAADLQEQKDNTQFFFAPEELLERNTRYTVVVNAEAESLGGTPLGSRAESAFYTVKPLRVDYSTPIEGGSTTIYGGITLNFSANLSKSNLDRYLEFSPPVENSGYYLYEDQRTMQLYGNFEPETIYILTVSPDLPDAWGLTLGRPFTLQFRTLPLDPSLSVGFGSDVLFMTPKDLSLPVQVTNLNSLAYTLGSVPLDDFMAMLGPDGYDIRQTYQPRGAQFRQQSLEILPNHNQTVGLDLSANGLEPGLYYLRFNTGRADVYAPPLILVVSNVQLTYKFSSTDALVWAVDLRDGTPVAGALVAIYNEAGQAIAEGETDVNGIFKTDTPVQEDLYATSYVVLGSPGQEQFSVALSHWNQGMSSWNFDIQEDLSPPRLKTYLYSDRPIYRPGDVVYFRGILRDFANGRYRLPEETVMTTGIYNEMGEMVLSLSLPVSSFGTIQGEITLPQDLTPGHYRLSTGDLLQDTLFFDVAEYRKPEIDLKINFSATEAKAGDSIEASIQARYYFGAPVSNAYIRWSLYAHPEQFWLPDYSAGPLDLTWLDIYNRSIYFGLFGNLIVQGEAQTRPDGSVLIEIPTTPTDNNPGNIPLRYTLEVSIIDDSSMPVSGHSSMLLHPGDLYIGLKPDSSLARSGSDMGFEVQLFDWHKQPAGEHTLSASFQKVTWVREEPEENDPFQAPRYVPVYSAAGHTRFVTAPDGAARLAFTLSEPGIYQLEVTGEGEGLAGSVSQVLVWSIGPGQAAWPEQPSQRLRLTPDRQQYQPGDTAQIFVPNPYGIPVQALITLERGIILHHQVVNLDVNGSTIPVTLSEEEAPNIYISATILNRNGEGFPDHRYGLAALEVESNEQTLQVEILQVPEAPLSAGESLTLGLRVTEASGEPVQGEFSLSVVDQAVLALADANSLPIIDAFYGIQPLGVRTVMSLAAYIGRSFFPIPGIGGGGGEDLMVMSVRDNYQDTAFWSANLQTDPNGMAWVTFTLPDNLTTWQVDVRGVTEDTRVGQANTQLTTSKELLVRPVTPRFLVVGDHVELAALIHNNSSANINAEAALQSSGFVLDDGSAAVQTVFIPAGGHARVSWWGQVQDVDKVDLLISASGGGLYDAARPATSKVLVERLGPGAIPVIRYLARQTFATSGLMDQGGERLELVSLPVNYSAIDGELRLEMSPSLAAAMISSLDTLERVPYESNEQAISRLLPNLEIHHALQELGVESQDLSHRLEQNLNDNLFRFQLRQNADGGWGWWPAPSYSLESNSDPYITAYILFGLSQARALGANVDEQVITRAIRYLYANMISVSTEAEPWELDRLAFQYFSLASAGAGDLGSAAELYEVRSQLSASSQAFLALTYSKLAADDPVFNDRSRDLLSDLQASSIRTGTGVHWQDQANNMQNISTPVFSTAVVVYALAKRDPAAPLLTDAVRYLMAHRRSNQGTASWASAFETSWSLLAVLEYAKGTGELSGDFGFSASVNGTQVAQGQAAGAAAEAVPVSSVISISNLYPNYPNELVFRREAGPGRLYYSAYLNTSRPAENVPPLSQGFTVARRYYNLAELRGGGPPVSITSINAGQGILARLTIVVPEDAYYVMVEDFIPAGTELLDVAINTNPQGEGGLNAPDIYDPINSFVSFGDWWRFHQPVKYDNRITWSSDFLPAGTYELSYLLSAIQVGEFRVLPAHTWQSYFPEVQGNSAGTVFAIKPAE